MPATNPLTRKFLFPALLVLSGWLFIVLGYWGPWVAAAAAGLRVLGLDLAEYVKFMAEVRSGQLVVTREVFYLPLVALSISFSLLAHRRELRLPTAIRWLLNLLAVPVALALLPPAWTPPLLTTPEFVKQTWAIGFCMLLALASWPLLRRLPARITTTLLVLFALLAVFPPLTSFSRLLPALAAIYHHPIGLGRGVWQMPLGWLLLIAGWLVAQPRHKSF